MRASPESSDESRRPYVRDPEAIYRESFAIIRREADLSRFPKDIANIATRLIHACGMTDIADELAYTPDVAERSFAALSSGATILCDSAMVAAGIMRARLPRANDIRCMLDDPQIVEVRKSLATTRSAAAVELWRPHLDDAIVAIGNAPTALFRLLEILCEQRSKPAAILAFPVGFVGAAESKQALIDEDSGVPYLTLRGRRGGSALAAAAVNALLLGAPE